MSIKDNRLYLGHIRDAIEKIESYIAHVDYEQFAANDMMVDAVVRELEILGEAANNLSPEFSRNHPDIPIRDMIDTRNVLIHNYAGVNTKIVWETCQKDLAELKSKIDELLA